nr:hypothetical protein [Tanacetum cinerariifolium]
QHLAKDLSFGDLFFNDKPSEADNEKIIAETEAKSMVSVIIQQDTSTIPPMITPVIDLTSRPDSPNVHHSEVESDEEVPGIDAGVQDEGQAGPNPGKQDEGQAGPQPQSSPVVHAGPNLEHMDLEATDRIDELEQIMANLIQDNKYLEERLDSHGPRLYILLNLDIPQQVRKAVDEIVTDETIFYKADEDYMMLYKALEKSMNRDHTDELLKDLAEARKKKKKRRDSPKTPPGSPPHQPPPPPPPLAGTSGTSGSPGASRSSQVPPPPPLPPSTNQEVHSSDDEDTGNAHIPKCQMEECHKLLTDSVDESIIRHNVSKPLPLGGPPGQVTIQSDLFFNKDLKYLRYDRKGSRHALSISKMKAAYYLDVCLEQMIKEHIIAKRDFKYLYPSDFEDLYLLNLQGIKSYQTQLNRTKPRWDATGFEYKQDFTVIDSPRAVTFRDKHEVQMIMWFNEIHKFSDGTLHQIDEALDYRVKEFKVNRMNPGLNTRFWTRKDVDRSKEFMFAIQKRLNTRRIFCNLESFVGK